MSNPFDETDAVLARKLAEIAPPGDLRARLLAQESGRGVVEARPVNWWARGITAVAAAIAILFAVMNLRPHSGDSIMVATTDLSKFLSGEFTLAMETSNVGKMQQWLASNNPNHPVSLPAVLMEHPPMGCMQLMWHDHPGSLACFSLGDGKIAHLAMFPTKIFSDAPGGTPKIASAGAWTRAAWSKDGMTYLLFVPAGEDPMKELAFTRPEVKPTSTYQRRSFDEGKGALGKNTHWLICVSDAPFFQRVIS